MSPITKIRVVLVGLEFGSAFVPLYLHHPNVEYLAICDLNEMKLTQVTREEVEHLMKEALQEHLQMMREENLPLPQSQTEAEYIDIPLSA